MVKRLTLVVFLSVFGLTELTHAQARRTPTPYEEVRQRRAAQIAAHNPYWDGFILKHEGNCTEAIVKLRPLAERGFGFEDAQTALGECFLDKAGLEKAGGTAPPRDALAQSTDFSQALKWIGQAANAGHFPAQALLINLYAAGLGPDEDKLEAAKWAHIYLTNPQRLNLGAPVQVSDSLAQLQADMDKESWLLGKERARIWVPIYSKPETGDAKKP